MKTLLLTGGSRGIGLSLCRTFAGRGWRILSCYHQDDGVAEKAREEMGALGAEFHLEKADITLAESSERLVGMALEKWGSLDCVLHNAGATWNARILNIEEGDWDAALDVHLKAAFHLTKAALRPMLKRRDGHFIFISSIVAGTGNIGQAGYTAAKAGLAGFSRSLAREYGPKNIRANIICPGFHKTKLSGGLSQEAEEAILGRHLLGRCADLGEVGEFAVWLAGTKSVSGQVFNLDSRLPGWL